MTRAIPFANAAWLGLCDLAKRAVAGDEDAAAMLGVEAGKRTAIAPPVQGVLAVCLCNEFRWACQSFSAHAPEDRLERRGSLKALEWRVRSLVEPPAPEPAADAGTDGGAEAPPVEPGWMKRADLNG
ncbi:hypothetical protein [Brevundimonas sp. A19_0]|uniref:hypothetical protein n=1 Tax=Brevundimonas sp. A19_0 TaxID=2821087 RepID=UPI001ADAC1F6|nr:hypothetical protein [Brevundimonas sp. A19_0]MBO9502040.1 hypothetical protein [Brevundimonas sp. A19_0]